MKPAIVTVLALAALLLLFSCNESHNDDITQNVNRSGSVETAVQVEHIDSLHDVLITSHKVWAQGQEVKTILYHDTIPALGTEHATAENKEGDTKNVTVKKDYEIFITVK